MTVALAQQSLKFFQLIAINKQLVYERQYK